MNRRKALAGLLATPLAPTAAMAQDSKSPECHCVCMEARDGAFLLQGSGQRLTEPFEIEPGIYRVEVEFSGSGKTFSAEFIRRADGTPEDLFMVIDEDAVPQFSSGSVDLTKAQEYLVEVYARGDWKIVLSPI